MEGTELNDMKEEITIKDNNETIEMPKINKPYFVPDPEQSEKLLKTTSRSIKIIFKNQTLNTLIRKDYLVIKGDWVIFPPEKIAPQETVIFGAGGFVTGTGFEIKYRMPTEKPEEEGENNNEKSNDVVIKTHNNFYEEPTFESSTAELYKLTVTKSQKEQEMKSKRMVEYECVFTTEIDLGNVSMFVDKLVGDELKVPFSPPGVLEYMRGSDKAVLVRVTNNSSYSLYRMAFLLNFGYWGILPPEIIHPKTEVTFGSFGYPKFAGTAGSISYAVSTEEKTGLVVFKWNHPFSIMDTYSVSSNEHPSVSISVSNIENKPFAEPNIIIEDK